MANFVQGKSIRLLEYGFQVNKAGVALPQNTTGTLFTVTGGRVVVTSLIGTVSTAIGNTSMTMSLGTAPTVGSLSTTGITIASAAILGREVGTHMWLGATAGSALQVGTNAGSAAQLTGGAAYVVTTGTITWTTSANNTGAVNWALTYIPLDDGAAVS